MTKWAIAVCACDTERERERERETWTALLKVHKRIRLKTERAAVRSREAAEIRGENTTRQEYKHAENFY